MWDTSLELIHNKNEFTVKVDGKLVSCATTAYKLSHDAETHWIELDLKMKFDPEHTNIKINK